jgi:hypothetical protein
MAKLHLNSINLFDDTFKYKGGQKVKENFKIKSNKISKFKKELVN